MPLSRRVARFQRRFMHPVLRGFATVSPGFGVIVHTGRRSGRRYRTPLNVFAVDGGFAIALVYGRESEWLRNLLAADGGELVRRRRRYRLSEPRIVGGMEAQRALPLYGRVECRVTRSSEVLIVRAEPVGVA